MYEIKESFGIRESNDYKSLTHLFNENGLEITPGIERPDNVIKCWECKDSVSQRLIGGASLETRDARSPVGWSVTGFRANDQQVARSIRW